jgi:acyl-CoA reductase-like NAD-dependent aldehyde dehydrogenase
VFGNVENSSTIGREEVFGPVLSVIPVDNEEQAIAVANDSIYGLNASVFTEDVDRARWVAGRLRSGTVGHNNVRSDFGMAFGGFKQSGIGREGGIEGLLGYLASPTFKATYTGLLKLFLDQFGQGELGQVTTFPLVLGGAHTHALAPELTFRRWCSG